MLRLTEEQREDLIRYIEEEQVLLVGMMGTCDTLNQRNMNAEFKKAEKVLAIALASLTALPEYYQMRWSDNGWTGFISFDAMIMAQRAGVETRSLYTIHPVPEIKFPELKGDGDIYTDAIGDASFYVGEESGWNACLSEIKRLNGLGE